MEGLVKDGLSYRSDNFHMDLITMIMVYGAVGCALLVVAVIGYTCKAHPIRKNKDFDDELVDKEAGEKSVKGLATSSRRAVTNRATKSKTQSGEESKRDNASQKSQKSQKSEKSQVASKKDETSKRGDNQSSNVENEKVEKSAGRTNKEDGAEAKSGKSQKSEVVENA